MTDHLRRLLDRREVVHPVPAPQQIGELHQLLTLPRIQLDANRAREFGEFGEFRRRQ
jgi:hypothetical protein